MLGFVSQINLCI